MRNDARVDARKWAASLAVVRANNSLRSAIRSYGMYSSEVGDAIIEAELAMSEYKKAAKL